jgi:peroxiredoxin
MMKMTSRRVMLATVLAVVLLAAVVVSQSAVTQGQKAVGFKLTSVDGKTVSLDDISKDPAQPGPNRVVLIQFFATWCHYCVQETPYLQRLSSKYGKKGLAVVGVAVDTDGASAVKPFVAEHKLTYTVLLDPNDKTHKSYFREPGVPATVLIDKQGVVRYMALGFYPDMAKELESKIIPLLK